MNYNILDQLIIKYYHETISDFEIRRRLILYIFSQGFLEKDYELPLVVMYGNMVFYHLNLGVNYDEKDQKIVDNIIHQIFA